MGPYTHAGGTSDDIILAEARALMQASNADAVAVVLAATSTGLHWLEDSGNPVDANRDGMPNVVPLAMDMVRWARAGRRRLGRTIGTEIVWAEVVTWRRIGTSSAHFDAVIELSGRKVNLHDKSGLAKVDAVAKLALRERYELLGSKVGE